MLLALVVLGAALVGISSTSASRPLYDANVRLLSLKVNGKGEALVTYRRSDGRLRHVLVWGALNARPPTEGVPQVQFKFDYAGGWGKYRNGKYWQTFKNRCRAYDGPKLPLFVAGCKAPDGTYWTIQSWQRRLPNLGFDPWLPYHTNIELHLAHWSGELPVLEVYPNWTYGGAWQGIFGRLTYLGMPVHGFSATDRGVPEGLLRTQPPHRHAQLGLRRGLEAGGRHPPAQGHRHVLPQLRSAEAVRLVPEPGNAARRAGRAVSGDRERPGRDSGPPGRGAWSHECRPRARRGVQRGVRQVMAGDEICASER